MKYLIFFGTFLSPHRTTSKGTPRAQKQNLEKSHENMAIKNVKAQKVIYYRAPLYTIFSYPFWYSLFKVKKNRQSRFCPNCEKVLFWPKFAPFGPKMGEAGFVSEMFRTLFSISIFPTSCQISRKSLEPFSGKTCHTQTHRQTDRQE